MNNYYPARRFDHSISSQISRDINAAFGDTTGRSITERTAQGLKKGLGLEMTDDNAGHVVHAAMIAAPALLRTENPWAKLFGLALGMTLFASYQNGKEYTFPQKRIY